MGCNSGSGGGGVSRYKGGKGMTGNDIVSERDMITERHTVEGVDEVLEVSRDFVNEYGDAVTLEGFAISELKPGVNAFGYYDGKIIGMNEKYFNAAAITAAYDADAKAGFHPSRGNKTAIQAVAAHEYGHAMTDAVGRIIGEYDIDRTATRIVNEAKKSHGKHRGVVQFESKISRYATQDNAEAVAEAFADVYCNGRRAASESRAIVNVCNKYLKK